jgi:phage/plasmid-like protein (TIGR03299 family)
MTHNIETKNGRASIVFAGQTPWHRLGQKVENAFDSQTALQEGGLDFTVEKVGIQCIDSPETIPNRFALRRTDTKDVLGVVTDFYKPLQNREAFAFFDGIFGKDKARYEVAGVLGKGEKVWLLAKLPGEFAIAGQDVLGKWLLLTNGHDTNEPVRARFTAIRVVCQNTLSAALRGKESEVRIQHIGDVQKKLEIAGKLLKSAGLYFDELQTVFRGFAKKQVTRKILRQFAVDVVSDRGDKFEDLTGAAKKTVSRIEDLHDTGAGHDLKSVRGTLWGAYNAVTEMVDHERTGKTLGFILDGRGAELKQRAFTVAQEMTLGAN